MVCVEVRSAIQLSTIVSFRFRSSIGGSVVECSPATRAARVRFPADATFLWVAGLTFPLKQTYVTRTLREP